MERRSAMKKRDIIKKLENAGFKKIRDDGDHTVYYKKGYPPWAVPRKLDTIRILLKSKEPKIRTNYGARNQNTGHLKPLMVE
jgi:predicted RNA binding protein YcfA (HicA-like mRNA interferase family)